MLQSFHSRTRMIITPSNVVPLYYSAHFMETKTNGPNLIPQIENFLEGIHFWTWSELLEALKQYQDLFPPKNSSTILDRILDSLIEKITLPSVSSPYTPSSSRSSFQFSCDSSSNNIWRNNSSGAAWWFEYLRFLKIDLIDKVIRTMIFHDFDHSTVSKFLFYYHKLSCLGAAQPEKTETTKVVINLLPLLDKRCHSCKDLFNLYRIATGLIISMFCKSRLENQLGLVLDQANVDYLLVPSPHGKDHAYDVDLVLRLSQIYVLQGDFGISSNQLKRVVKLIDSFLVEIAPDPHLKPSEFAALIKVVPETARESHEQLYIAMDLYFRMHAGLDDKEKKSICNLLNFEKMAAGLLRHLNENLAFPLEAKPKAHVSRQGRIKSLLQENSHLKNFFDSAFRKSFKRRDVKEDVEKRIYAVAKIQQSTEEQSGTELSGFHYTSNAKYFPKLCS